MSRRRRFSRTSGVVPIVFSSSWKRVEEMPAVYGS